MTAKNKTTRSYAPPLGSDPEFEESLEKVMKALESAGNPDGISPEQARQMLARRNIEFGGKSYTTSKGEPEKAEEVAPAKLVIPTPSENPYWYEKPEDAQLVEHYILTRRAMGNRLHGALLIVGPAGSGKTQGVGQAVMRINATHGLQMRLLRMDCATITDPQKWFGRREIDASGSHYHESDFIKALTSGDGILLDEITRLHPTIANPIMSVLDGSQSLHLSELNQTFDVHPQTWFVATANIGVQFGGTHRLDWAMRERMTFTIEREFPPVNEEIRILTTHTGCDPDAASVLVDVAIKTRQMYLTGDLRSPISTRTLVNAAWLVSSGYTERDALSYTALPLYDGDANGTVGEKSERMSVRAIIDGRTKR